MPLGPPRNEGVEDYAEHPDREAIQSRQLRLGVGQVSLAGSENEAELAGQRG